MTPCPHGQSPTSQQLHAPVALEQIQQSSRRIAARAVQAAVAGWAASHGVFGNADDCFGNSWVNFQERILSLAATPVRPADLPVEIARMERLAMTTDLRNGA